jgi:predicted methyltransferase
MRILLVMLAAASVVACQPADQAGPAANENTVAAEPATTNTSGNNDLAAVLAAQPEEVQARYSYRHPQETLEFFEVEPGMTVVEALPGGGWYSKILIPYLGTGGQLIGADYSIDMYPLFGFFDEAFVNKQKTWVTDWTAEAALWYGDDGAPVSAFKFGSMPESMIGTADRVLFIRAMHNLARFEDQGGYLTAASADAWRALKPGGILGIVQHHARDDKSDEFALGDHGYLKKSFVIAQMQAAGFEFAGEIDINANASDQPGDDDIVWRLPPTLMGSEDDAGAKAAAQAIGESNRMTLKFRKPE